MVEREPERPLSPELVLVSPDLRERALLEERDVPVPPQAEVDPPTASVAPAPRVPLPSPPAAPPRAEAAPGPVERRRLTAGAATAIALTALILFGAGLAVGKLAFPTSTARSPAAPRAASRKPRVIAPVPRTSSSASTTRSATSTARSPAAPRAASRKPRVIAPVPRTSSSAPTTRSATSTARSPAAPRAASRKPRVIAPVPRTSSSASTTRSATSTARSPAAPRAASRKPRVIAPVPRTSSSASTTLPARQPGPSTAPIPNSGYVFSDGTFRLSGTGRRILDFTLRTTCSGPLTLPPIEVGATGTFSFSGQPPGALPGTAVRVTGRFVSPVAARGTTRVTRGTCHGPTRPFAAHLS